MRYLQEILDVASATYRCCSSYVSVLTVKAGEMHVVPSDRVVDSIFLDAKPRPRMISGPAKGVSEVKTAVTWLVQDLAKKVFPEMALGENLE